MLKILTIALAGTLFSFSALAKDTFVSGYTKKDGTYVMPHYRTAPNNTKSDNYSTYGNINPYTGKEGSKKPDNYDNKVDSQE